MVEQTYITLLFSDKDVGHQHIVNKIFPVALRHRQEGEKIYNCPGLGSTEKK